MDQDGGTLDQNGFDVCGEILSGGSRDQLSDTLQLAEEIRVAFMLIWSVASIPRRGGVPMSMSCITSSRTMYEMTVYAGLIPNQTLFFLAVHTSISPLLCSCLLPCRTIDVLLDMFEAWSC